MPNTDVINDSNLFVENEKGSASIFGIEALANDLLFHITG